MAESDNKATPGVVQPQPGQVVAPGAAPSQSPEPQPTVAATPAQQTQSTSSPQPSAPSETVPQAPLARGESASAQAREGAISWTASEFVAHEKSAGWYGGLLIIALVIAGFVYLLTRDFISTLVVLVGAGAFGILGSRKPRQLQYHLDAAGISIGQKHFAYETFRSFSVVPEGAFSSIVFMPLKRFASLTTIYYAPEDEDKIIDVLAQRLPFEESKTDAVDNLMRRIRF